MQLDPKDGLVLVSGLGLIRAKKRRYYEDPHFKARILPPPSGGTEGGAYPDRPKPRPNDWGSLARRTDARLEGAVDAEAPEDEGGPQQQRTPEIADEPPAPAAPPRQIDALGPEQDDAEPANDNRALARSRT